MTTVTISSKFQVVIPQEIRKAFPIHPGEKFEVVPYENRLELIPLKPIEEMKGFLKGIKMPFKRQRDRI